MRAGSGTNGRSVLVVEDDREINSLVGDYAGLCGFKYLQALNGRRGIEQARADLPDLIILDLMLPDFDGFEVFRQLKSDMGTREIPVVMFTALNDDATRARGLELGAAAYIVKPFDPDHLMNTMKRFARS